MDPGNTPNTAMVERRRATDARYGFIPNRLGHYFQYQVIYKIHLPTMVLQESTKNGWRLWGIDLSKHDVKFEENGWE